MKKDHNSRLIGDTWEREIRRIDAILSLHSFLIIGLILTILMGMVEIFLTQ